MTDVRVFGLGNPARGDDGVGWLVVGQLRERVPSGVEVQLSLGEAFGLIEAWSGAEVVIVVDAVSAGSPPGTIHRLDARRDPLPSLGSTCAHGLGLAEALALARKIGRVPPRVIVWGIEARSFELGAGLSREVAAAIPDVVDGVLDDVATSLANE